MWKNLKRAWKNLEFLDKQFIVVLVVLAICTITLFFIPDAFAGTNKNTGEVCKGSDCSGGSSPANVTNRSSNQNRNVNRNRNSNANSNSNVNTNTQKQGQDQVLLNMPVNVDIEHITAPVNKTDVDMVDHRYSSAVKTRSFNPGNYVVYRQAELLSKNAKDVKIVVDMMEDMQGRRQKLIKNLDGEEDRTIIGSITAISTGPNVTLMSMMGLVLKTAMENGATGFDMWTDSSLHLEASQSGIDFGSAGSHVLRNDGAAILGAGTSFGYTKAWSKNEMRPEIFCILYYAPKDALFQYIVNPMSSYDSTH